MTQAFRSERYMHRFIPQAFGLSLLLTSAFPLPAAAQAPHVARDLAANCFTCHGTNGNSVQGIPPSLAGRDASELFLVMKDFQTGKRPATIMHQLAKGYTDQQLKLISTYLAALKPAPARTPAP
jgi:sulfide dehydrogenase cytochrome subunit